MHQKYVKTFFGSETSCFRSRFFFFKPFFTEVHGISMFEIAFGVLQKEIIFFADKNEARSSLIFTTQLWMHQYMHDSYMFEYLLSGCCNTVGFSCSIVVRRAGFKKQLSRIKKCIWLLASRCYIKPKPNINWCIINSKRQFSQNVGCMWVQYQHGNCIRQNDDDNGEDAIFYPWKRMHATKIMSQCIKHDDDTTL